MTNVSILVVEDEEGTRAMLSRSLEMRGHQAVSVGSSEEACDLLQTRDFDIVIIDLLLPGQSGLQSISHLQSLTDAPIFMMSGQNNEDTRRDAELLGASGFLPKPIDLDVLDTLIASLRKPQD